MTIPFVLDLISTIGDGLAGILDSVDLGIRQVPKAEFLAGSLYKSGLLHTDRFEQFLLGGEKFRRIKSSKCLPGTYGLAGELDVSRSIRPRHKLFATADYVRPE